MHGPPRQTWSRPQPTEKSLRLPADPTPTPAQVSVHHVIVCVLVSPKSEGIAGWFLGKDIGLFLKDICRSSLEETDSFETVLISLLSQ